MPPPARTERRGRLPDRSSVYALLSRVGGRAFAGFVMRMTDLVGFVFAGIPRYSIGSIDITHRCNLHCRHCYFLAQGYRDELTDEEWIARLDDLRDHTAFPFYQCSWVGGEPLLRKDLVARLLPRFKSNLITTNGSIPLPDWPNCSFYVSVDGTREYYTRVRGRGDLYDRIKTNIRSAPHLRITAAMCVDRENWRCIPEMLAEWYPTAVRGFIFQFFTPIEGLDDALWPGWELRDRILDMLLRLKRTYGDFIVNTPDQLRLMKSAVAPSVTRDCQYAKIAYALGPDGKRKLPCMMGEKADCERCGCILPFHAWLLDHQNVIIREIVLSLRRMVHDRRRRRERDATRVRAR